MPRVDDLESGAWNFLGDAFGDRDRADVILPARDDQCRTLDGFEQTQKIGLRHHAKRVAKSHRIVRHIATAIILIGLAVRELPRIGFVEHRRDHAAYAFAFGKQRDIVKSIGAAWIDPGRWIAEDQRPDLAWFAIVQSQRLHARSREGYDVIGSRQIEPSGEALKIVDQRPDAVGLPNLFRQTESALVVAEDAKALRQIGNDAIPAVEGAADLVQQNHRGPARALNLVMKTDPVGLDERQCLSPCLAEPECMAPRSAVGPRHRLVQRPGTPLSLVSRRPMNVEPLACPSSLQRNTFQTKGELA